ncbi:MAG: hypothetical protein C5B59_14655 [Bacteroidetes bacterium]|nr:MAG: hypothetical protein C5B59_14655 [Bacteroidota bacterium]
MQNENGMRDEHSIRSELSREENNFRNGIKNGLEFKVIKAIRQKIIMLLKELEELSEMKKTNK